MNTEIAAQTAVWWLVLAAIAVAGLPLAWRLLGHLPGGGYAFARAVGLLVAGYAYWLGLMLGLFRNGPGAAAVAVFMMGVAGWLTLGGDGRRALVLMVRRQSRLIMLEELLFFIALLAWTVVRAHNPEIAATEKPMEIAFLNSAVRSEVYPPLDPWLSGFSISYYYFGYVIVAMLTWLSGLPTEVTFNLAIATLFSLTVLGTFGLVYELVAWSEHSSARYSGRAARYGVLGAVLLTLMGNLEGYFEVLHSHGVTWPALWKWLAIRDLGQPYMSPEWFPTDTWWWWRASRVIGTVGDGAFGDYTINEFPFFSFMLGDLHPHVLALPFTLTALALAFSVLTRESVEGMRPNWGDLLLMSLAIGALGFLNSWDLPTYLALAVASFALARWAARTSLKREIRQIAGWAVGMLGASIALYLPFYLTFRSQASGVGVVLFTRTQLHHFLIFWGPLLWLVWGLLAMQWWAARGTVDGNPRLTRLALLWACLLIALLLGVFGLWVAALLVIMFGAGAWVIVGMWARGADERPAAAAFVMLLVIVACWLLLFPEFLFIRDTFNSRMNTVFKFYYQAWVLLAVAGTFALYSANARLTAWASGRSVALRAGGWLWLGAATLLIAGAFIYPVAAVWSKTEGFAGPPTLDGMAFIRSTHADEYEAIKWLAAHPEPQVIVEATGPEYSSDFARVSAFTGFPAMLGWAGHELQWRGTSKEASPRDLAITQIYESNDTAMVLRLLHEYDVRYVYAGSSERGKHGPDVDLRLERILVPEFRNGSVTIYRVPQGG